MMPVKQAKGKAPILRKESAHLIINPNRGVGGLVVMIYHLRSTNPMGGVPHLLPRSLTQTTNSCLVMTISLSLHEGTTMVRHHRTQIIHPALRNMVSHHQDLLPATPMSGSEEVSWMHVPDFVVCLAIDNNYLLGDELFNCWVHAL
jgi:hypothetical protein